MAYNYSFPYGYPYGYNAQPNVPNTPYNNGQNVGQTIPQSVQNNAYNGFVRVQSEEQARQYPVPQGTSVIFIDENSPYCYTKTMDISQLDKPRFEKYKLVKEPIGEINDHNTDDVKKLSERLDTIEGELESLKAKMAQIPTSVCE